MSAAPIRVAMVSTQVFPHLGGIESHVEQIAPRIAAAGYDLTLVSTDRTGQHPAQESRDGLKIRRRRAYPRTRDYYLSPGLFWEVLRGRFDLVHIQGINALVPPTAMIAAIIARTPFVLTFHSGGATSAFRRRARSTQFRLLAPLLRRAAALIAVSEYEARVFEPALGWSAGTIPVIRNGGFEPDDPTSANEPESVAVDPNVLVSVGRLERYKGHHRVIEALPLLLRENPEIRLRILGAGPYHDDLLRLAAKLGVSEHLRIEYFAPPDRAGLTRALREAALVVLLSDYEAHPVAVMEALALERPVLVTRTSGMIELVDAGWVGGVARSADTPTIAAAIRGAIADPPPVVSSQLPTWESSAAQLLAVYNQVLHRVRQ